MPQLIQMLLLMVFLSVATSLTAQPPTCEECAEQSYLMLGCRMVDGEPTGGSECFRNREAAQQAGFNPLRICLPKNYAFEDNLEKLAHINDKSGERLFSQDDMHLILQESFSAWTNLCPPHTTVSTDCVDCGPVKISFANSAIEMDEDPKFWLTLAVANSGLGKQPGTCDFLCEEQPSIIINASPYLMYWQGDDEVTPFMLYGMEGGSDFDPRDQIIPYNFFFTNPNANINDYSSKGRGWFDIRHIMHHEIGHIFGMGDYYEGNTSAPCDYYEATIMKGSVSPGVQNTQLSFMEQCFFKTMYCCPDAVSVQEQLALLQPFPNPTADMLSIPLPEGGSNIWKVRFISITGQVIELGNEYTSNGGAVTISTSGLARGSYILHCSGGGKTLVYRFVKSD